MATAIATVDTEGKRISPKKEIRQELEQMGEQLRMALPSHISVDKFHRVTMTAIQSDPDLLNADRRTLFSAITRAAQDGLLPDKREGALVIFKTKRKGRAGQPDQYISAVQWMPMVAGILKKVRQSGEIAGISAHVIYENDEFVWTLGDDEKIMHQPPPLGSNRGSPIGAYAVATLKDGFKVREVMDIHQIEKVRSVSRAGQYGPWKDWWEEMAKKTVIRRLSKRLPMSTDLEGVIAGEDTDADFAGASARVMQLPGNAPLTSEMLTEQAETQVGDDDEDEADDQPADETPAETPVEAAEEAPPAPPPPPPPAEPEPVTRTVTDMGTGESHEVTTPKPQEPAESEPEPEPESTTPGAAEPAPADTRPLHERMQEKARTGQQPDASKLLTLDQAKEQIDRCEIVVDITNKVAELVTKLSEEDAEEIRKYGAAKVNEKMGG